MGTLRQGGPILAALAGAALLAVAAAACGGTSSTDKTATASAGRASTPAAAATSAPTTAATTAATAAATPSTGGGSPSSGGIAVGSTSLGPVLVDGGGMTLYLFKNDTAGSGKSACYGQCATNWPPATVTSVPAKPAGASGTLATITRDDGAMQLTYNGLPLYRFAADTAPGDTKGEGVGGVWSVAKP